MTSNNIRYLFEARDVITPLAGTVVPVGHGGALTRPSQKNISLDRNAFVEIQAESVSGTPFNGSTASYNVQIGRMQVELIEKVVLHIQLTSSADSYVIPAPAWIRNITVRSNRGSGPILQTISGDALMSDLMLLSRSQVAIIGDSMIMDSRNMAYSWPRSFIAAGETRDFYIPLYSFLSTYATINMQTISDGIQVSIDFVPSIITDFSGASTFTLNKLALICETDRDEEKIGSMRNLVKTLSFNVPDVETVTTNGVQLIPGTTTAVKFNAANKLLSHMIVIVRGNNSTTTPMGFMNAMYLGDNATFEITENTEPLLGRGTPLSQGLLQQANGWTFDSEFCGNPRQTAKRAYTLLSFSDAPQAFIKYGAVDNVYDCRTTNTWLNITPDSTAGVLCVQTISQTAAAASGSYAFTYKGQISSQLAYNATVAQMKQAFESIPAAIEDMLNVTFSATMAAGTSLTMSGNNYRPIDLIGVIPLGLASATPTNLFPSVAMTTTGVYGLPAGANNYDVTIVTYCVNEVIIKDGQIAKRTLI